MDTPTNAIITRKGQREQAITETMLANEIQIGNSENPKNLKLADRVAIANLNLQADREMRAEEEKVIIACKMQLDVIRHKIDRAERRNDIELMTALEAEESTLLAKLTVAGTHRQASNKRKFLDVINYGSKHAKKINVEGENAS